MKKLFTLIAFIGLGFAANAQHTSDLTITMTSPAAGSTGTVIDTGNITLTGYVTNDGPSATKATDTLYNFIMVGGHIISYGSYVLFGNPANFGRVLNVGDTMHMTLVFPMGTFLHNTADTPRVMCLGVYAISNAADTIADDFTDNSSCADVIFKGTARAAVANVAAQLGSVSLYPNPVKDQANVEVNLTQAASVSVRVMDMVGREVYMQNAGKMDAGKHTFNVNTSNFANGIYMYQVTVGNETKTGKFNVAK